MRFDMRFYEEKKKEYRSLPKEYAKRKKTFEQALSDVERKIALIKRQHERQTRLRIAYIDGRIKSIHSLIRKAVTNKIPAEKVFESIEDIIGVRVVVNNLKDIEPLIEEIKKIPEFSGFTNKVHTDEAGYRAMHLKTVYSLTTYDGRKEEVKIEIQLRSLLQDAFAILSHHDVYKNKADLPELAANIFKTMSRMLHVLDKTADDFRTEIESKVEPPNDLSDDAPLDREGISFLYFELFGEPPEEYEVQYLTKMAMDYGVKSVGDARKGFSEDILGNLEKIHNKRFSSLPADNMELFQYGLLYSQQGKLAYKEYRKRIEQEWAEIEATARSEILSAMPGTFEEFVELLENGRIDWYMWQAIGELGGTGSCARCSATILIPESAAEAVLDFYDVDDSETDVDLVSMFINPSGVDAPQPESVNLSGCCPYCGDIMTRDD